MGTEQQATGADLNEAQEIIMEDSGSSVLGEGDSRTSIFGETVPTQEQLSGEVKNPAPSQSSDKKDEDTSLENAPKKEDEGKEKGDADEGNPAPDEDKKSESADELPDEIAKLTEHKKNLEKALSEERAKNKSLKYMYEQKIVQPNQNPEPKPTNPDFKILSKPEFEELKESDPMSAIQYMHDLQDHKDFEAHQKTFTENARREEESLHTTIAKSIEELSLAIPGVYEDESVGKQLTDFAVEKGFDADDLSILSNPGTMVIDPVSKKAVPLGKAAVSFVKFCNDSMRSSDTSQLKADLTKEISAQLIKKFKTTPAGLGLDDVPRVGSEAPTQFVPKTENELRGMTASEREAYYAGN